MINVVKTDYNEIDIKMNSKVAATYAQKTIPAIISAMAGLDPAPNIVYGATDGYTDITRESSARCRPFPTEPRQSQRKSP